MAASQDTQNAETTQKGYAAFAAGDVETTLSMLNDDVEWWVGGNSAISGTYRGKAEVTELFAKLAEQSLKATPSQVFAGDHHMVALSEVTAGGESAPEAHVFTFRDGRIAKAEIFGDTAMHERVFGRK